ncbi:hypothetical protein L3Y34_013845 [Caenorhabditis briggsae]|uniref:Uncharacterized protein n=1 Tax=Caenorhabditis briggsae TaxID=6238 RepID=A0AAE9A2K7_CAEBR|nr:hypothetical protein L3Y34_013845 [Caenorhabditis briggsae]
MNLAFCAGPNTAVDSGHRRGILFREGQALAEQFKRRTRPSDEVYEEANGDISDDIVDTVQITKKNGTQGWLNVKSTFALATLSILAKHFLRHP